jgi:hypothetical protein
MRHARSGRFAALLAVLVSLVLVGGSAIAADPSESKGFRKGVTVAGIRQHQQALQDIADDNDDTRSSGTPGYQESVDYVVGRLEDAGYDPVVQPFDFAFYQQLAPSTFARTAPNPRTYVEGASAEYAAMTYSGSGDVTANVTHVTDAGGAIVGNGCEAADFAGYAVGTIALIQRGGCTFKIKATNAQAAGAAGVVIYNNVAGPLNGTLGSPGQTIPVVGTLQSIGEENVALLGSGPVTFHLATSTARPTTSSPKPPAATLIAWSSSAPTSTAVSKGPGSTTTARARPRSSRSPRRSLPRTGWPATSSGSCGTAARNSTCSARRST